MDYPKYDVEGISSFYEFYNKLFAYSKKVAYIKDDQSILYEEFLKDIRVFSASIDQTGRFFILNIRDKYLFSVAYFATVISGNIACLQEASDKNSVYMGYPDNVLITDTRVEEIIKNCDCRLNYRPNAGISTVLCSSGTTSRPKAIALTQYNILSALVSAMEMYEFRTNDVYVSILPFYHVFGLSADFLAPLLSGATICPVYDVITYFAALSKVNPTTLNITPKIAQILLERLKSAKDKTTVVGKNLRKMLSGGAPIEAHVCQKIRDYGIGIYNAYGLSECSSCVCVNRDNYYKDGSVGLPISCNQIQIDDTGKIIVIGENIMMGYLDSRGEIIQPANKRFMTNDIGYFDDNGFLFVIGRTDDLIILGDGTKIMPQPIESKIASFSGIRDVTVALENDLLTAYIVVEESADRAAMEKKVLQNNYGYIKVSKVVFEDNLQNNEILRKKRRKLSE